MLCVLLALWRFELVNLCTMYYVSSPVLLCTHRFCNGGEVCHLAQLELHIFSIDEERISARTVE